MKKKTILISTISLSILIFIIIYTLIISYKSRRDYLENYFSDMVTEDCKMKSFGEEIGQKKYKDYTLDKNGNLKWACERENGTTYKPERLRKNINGLKCEFIVCIKDPHIDRIYVIRGTDPMEGPRYNIKI